MIGNTSIFTVHNHKLRFNSEESQKNCCKNPKNEWHFYRKTNLKLNKLEMIDFTVTYFYYF